MDDEKLIETVRVYPVLYDMSNPKYMDSDFKNKLWNKIGMELKVPAVMGKIQYTQKFRNEWLNIPALRNWLQAVPDDNKRGFCKYCKCTIIAKLSDLKHHSVSSKHRRTASGIRHQTSLDLPKKNLRPTCKTRWSNIRDNFRKSLKKNATMSGQKAKCVKLYKYSEQLSFMKKHFNDWDARNNVNEDVTKQELADNDDDDGSVLCESVENDENMQQCMSEEVDNFVAWQSQGHTSFDAKETDPLECSTPSTRPKQSVQKATPPLTAVATFMEYLNKKNEGVRSSPLSHDPVDAFLSGIAPALKELSPHHWHYAKADLFAVVQKYEFKMLTGEQPPVESSSNSVDPNVP